MRRRERGASLVEYSLAASLVLVASLGALSTLQSRSSNALNTRANAGAPAEVNALPPGAGGNSLPPFTPPTSGPGTVHAGQFQVATSRTATTWTSTISIVVVSPSGQPYSGVTVTGTYTPGVGTQPITCTTDTTGRCNLTQIDNPLTTTQITFTLNSLSGSGISHDAGSDVLTSIAIDQPPP